MRFQPPEQAANLGYLLDSWKHQFLHRDAFGLGLDHVNHHPSIAGQIGEPWLIVLVRRFHFRSFPSHNRHVEFEGEELFFLSACQLLHGLQERYEMLLILAPELQMLKIRKGGDWRFDASQSVFEATEGGGDHLVPFADFLDEGLDVVFAVVPGIDPFFGPRIIRVVGPAILAFVVHLDLHGRQGGNAVQQVNDA